MQIKNYKCLITSASANKCLAPLNKCSSYAIMLYSITFYLIFSLIKGVLVSSII